MSLPSLLVSKLLKTSLAVGSSRSCVVHAWWSWRECMRSCHFTACSVPRCDCRGQSGRARTAHARRVAAAAWAHGRGLAGAYQLELHAGDRRQQRPWRAARRRRTGGGRGSRGAGSDGTHTHSLSAGQARAATPAPWRAGAARCRSGGQRTTIAPVPDGRRAAFGNAFPILRSQSKGGVATGTFLLHLFAPPRRTSSSTAFKTWPWPAAACIRWWWTRTAGRGGGGC
jgi:hypothetical protein